MIINIIPKKPETTYLKDLQDNSNCYRNTYIKI